MLPGTIVTMQGQKFEVQMFLKNATNDEIINAMKYLKEKHKSVRNISVNFLEETWNIDNKGNERCDTLILSSFNH